MHAEHDLAPARPESRPGVKTTVTGSRRGRTGSPSRPLQLRRPRCARKSQSEGQRVAVEAMAILRAVRVGVRGGGAGGERDTAGDEDERPEDHEGPA